MSDQPAPPKVLLIARHLLRWTFVVLVLAGAGTLAYKKGISLRHEIWTNSRTIRFEGDISNGYKYGNRTMRLAEVFANQPSYSDVLADQSKPEEFNRFRHLLGQTSKPITESSQIRRLTLREVFYGVVRFYDGNVDESNQNEDNYRLDYLPARLAVMTLWARFNQHLSPAADHYPEKGVTKEDTEIPRPEDAAEPVLEFNTWCEGEAAVAMLLLVWLWVARSSKVGRFGSIPAFFAAGESRSPNTSTNWNWRGLTDFPRGMLVFLIAGAGFWYVYLNLIGPPPRPTPVLQITHVEPRGNVVIVNGLINSQQAATRWKIEYGSSTIYNKSTPFRSVGTSLNDAKFSGQIPGIDANQPIHFRLVATNTGGYTVTDDVTYTPSSGPMDLDMEQVGGMVWPGWFTWVAVMVIFAVMVAAARRLPMPHRGWACGLIAGLLVWFDPITLLNSHAWPQWDVWILPFFVTAYLLASVRFWVAAGFIVGVGAMFKGQMLLGAAVLVAWPLFAGQIGSALRAAAGMALGAGLILWPFLISQFDPSSGSYIVNPPEEIRWIRSVMIAAVLAVIVSRLGWLMLKESRRYFDNPDLPKLSLVLLILGFALAADVVWHAATYLVFKHTPADARVPITFMDLLLHFSNSAGPWLMTLALAIVIVPWFLTNRFIGYWLVIVMAAIIWIAPVIYNGDFGWKHAGIDYGGVKFQIMAMGNMSYSNLPQLMNLRYRWDLYDSIGTLTGATSVVGMTGSDFEVKNSLAWVYCFTLFIASVAAAIHWRRKDSRILLALMIPWLMFPMVMGQMSERYMLWFSAGSAVVVTLSTGLTLLHALYAIMAAGMISGQLMTQYGDPGRWPEANDFFIHNYPEVAWLMMLIAIIFLVASVIPSRKKPYDGLPTAGFAPNLPA